jgi:hypothetical protein
MPMKIMMTPFGEPLIFQRESSFLSRLLENLIILSFIGNSSSKDLPSSPAFAFSSSLIFSSSL